MTTVDDWAHKFGELRPRYAEFQRRIEALLLDLIREAGIDFVQIESRTKDVESLREKLARKKVDDENALSQVHDLVGLRVITYYLEDISRVASVLRDQFEVDTDNSIDKAEALSSDQFGYLSAHYVVSLRDDRRRLPEWQAYEGMVAEVQVRTALQHAWAAVSHKLDYKSAKDAPDAMRRRLYRLSALFEMADEQFSTLRDQAEFVDSQYRESVDEGNLDVPLDSSSLRAYLTMSPAARSAVETWTGDGFSDDQIDSDRVSRDRSDLLSALKGLGMSTLADLDGFLRGKARIRKISKALAGHEVSFMNLTLEDWLTQVLLVAFEDPGGLTEHIYNVKAARKISEVRQNLSL